MSLVVDLGDRSYPIIIESGALKHKKLAKLVAGKKVCVITNPALADLYFEPLCSALGDRPVCVNLPEGESHKTLSSIESIFDRLLQAKFNRSSILIALGGGVVGDMTGFAAACYQRGIDFIQIPTTLLAQVDSSVGGKTGVNHPLGKNMIGAFYQPLAVFIDISTLHTLPEREFSAGLAEVIKYGLIYDAEFFDWLDANMQKLLAKDEEALAYAIERSCEIKAQVVAQDEREGGIRAILNLGHTFGHAIESGCGYGEYLHGEAVAIGMVMAIDLSVRLGQIDSSVLTRTKQLLVDAKLPITAPKSLSVEQFLEIMAVDKKNIQGSIRLVLLKALGEAYVTDDYDQALMCSVIADNCQ